MSCWVMPAEMNVSESLRVLEKAAEADSVALTTAAWLKEGKILAQASHVTDRFEHTFVFQQAE